MSPVQFLVAKYIPDLRRMEPRNIGVVVWSNGVVAARFAAERSEEPGKVDGRSLPRFVTSLSAYKQWVQFWRKELEKTAVRPLSGGEPVPRNSPEYLKVLASSSRGNFVLVESGQLLDAVADEDLPQVLDHLYRVLVEEAAQSDEPRDPRLEDVCQKLIEETHVAATPLFHRRFPLVCTVLPETQETFEFSYAIANGSPIRLYHQLPLLKGRDLLKRNVHHVAWMFEKVIASQAITPGQGGILVYPTEEQMDDSEIQSSLGMLGSITRVLNLQQYEAVKDEFSNLTQLAVTHDVP